MRDRETIEREMYTAREDLEQNLADLKHVVREKVDIKARARKAMSDAVTRGKDSARELAVRSKQGAIRAYRGAVDTTRENPVLVSSIAAGVILATVVTLYVVHQRRKTWWDRLWD